LGGALLDITLSDHETNDLRTVAAYAIGTVGTNEERELLRPLLHSSRETDPNDELRGAALNAIYPGDKYDDAMWDYLDHPRKSLFFGAYNSFLSYVVGPKLTASNLPSALRWCLQQPVEDLGPIPELEAEIVSLAVEHIEADGVADLLAQVIFQRCRSYRGFPQRRHGEKVDSEKRLLEDDTRRRRFLDAFLPLLNPDNVHVLVHPLSILALQDLHWLIDRVVYGTSSSPGVEAKLVCRLVCSSWDAEAVKAIWDGCQINPALAAECNSLFEPVPLNSEMATSVRQTREDYLREHNIQVAPALGPRVEAALVLTEAGKAEEWLRVINEMSVDEGGTHYVDFQHMNIEKLPGWTTASAETRARVLAAGKQFLAQSTFPDLDASASQQIRNGASAAVSAFALLQSNEPEFLETLAAEFWIRWVPSLVEDGRAGREKEPPIIATFQVAANAARDAMNARLLEQLRVENKGEQRFFFSSTMVDLAWSESLGALLLNELRDNTLVPSIQGSVLYKLLENDVPGAREWAEETIRVDYQSERGMAISRALLNADVAKAWTVLWPIMQDDVAFGRMLLESASYGRPDKSAFAADFTMPQLEQFYGWLLEQYPPTNDREVSGAIGPVDTVRFLRDGSLELLKNRGTFEACDVLTRTELRFPQYRWLRYHFDQAEVLACAQTWEAPSPQDILAMAADSSKRFVESSEQLLDVILESLHRLQAELHGELASVVDLWNAEGKRWWPKQEEDVSDYIARFLKRDLADRGIVVNREVQIRRGRPGEMPGQRTDIHVDAPESDQTEATHYGAISVVIEVKGSWNDGLMTDMEEQLRDRYLKNSGCRTGLYVVAHFTANAWSDTDSRGAKSNMHEIDDLRTSLEGQAADLSGGVLLRSLVLDASLDSTQATGVEDEGERG